MLSKIKFLYDNSAKLSFKCFIIRWRPTKFHNKCAMLLPVTYFGTLKIISISKNPQRIRKRKPNLRLITFEQNSIGVWDETARNVYHIWKLEAQKRVELEPPLLNLFRKKHISQWCQCCDNCMDSTTIQFGIQFHVISSHVHETTAV